MHVGSASRRLARTWPGSGWLCQAQTICLWGGHLFNSKVNINPLQQRSNNPGIVPRNTCQQCLPSVPHILYKKINTGWTSIIIITITNIINKFSRNRQWFHSQRSVLAFRNSLPQFLGFSSHLLQQPRSGVGRGRKGFHHHFYLGPSHNHHQ